MLAVSKKKLSMNSWFKDNKLLLLVIIGIISAMGLYMAFGHSAVKAAYDGKSLSVLNKAIEGQSEYPVKYYYNKSDRLVFGALSSLLIIAFYFIFFLSRGLKKNGELVALGAFGLVFLGIFLFIYRNALVDDLYIMCRFSKNLVQGNGLVWNIQDGPVEGYTSFAWVILNTIPALLNVSHLVFSRAIAITAVLGILAILVISCKKINRFLGVMFVGMFALNISPASLAMIGMETTTAAFLLLIAGLLSIKITSEPKKKNMYFLFGVFFISFLVRPDTAIFNAGIILGILTVFIMKKDYKPVKNLFMAGAPFILLGCLYIAWRASYFGHLFPNTFYVKGLGDTFFKITGLRNVRGFYYAKLYPYAIIITILAFVVAEKSLIGPSFLRRFKNNLKRVLPTMLGCIMFGAYLTTINPMADYTYRFSFPMYPSIILSSIYLFSGLKFEFLAEKRRKTLFVIAACFTLLTVRGLWGEAFFKQKVFDGFGRPEGRELAKFNGSMFVSEAGQLPFFSGWRALDLWALTSEKMAHEGLSSDILEDLNPDFVSIFYRGIYSEKPCWNYEWVALKNRENPRLILDRYMRENDFVAIAGIKRIHIRRRNSLFSYYFAKKGSEHFKEITEIMTSIEGVEYIDLEMILTESGFPVYKQR